MPMTPPSALTRREGLIALALGSLALPLAGVAGCSSGPSSDTPSTSTDALPTVPAELAARVAAEEQALIARYDAALASLESDGAADAGTVRLLTSIRDQHVAHREALGGAGDAPAGTAPSTVTVSGLIDLERAAARSRVRSCVEADDPSLARLLSLIAASEASHLPALRSVPA